MQSSQAQQLAMTVMLVKVMLLFAVLIGPPFVISYLLATRYRKQVLRAFPFLRGYVFQAIFVLWLFFSALTFVPTLTRVLAHP